MKKTIITTLIFAASITAFAQTQPSPQKQLPPSVHIELSDKQVIRLDSLIQRLTQQIDSKAVTNNIFSVVEPIYKQVEAQMVPVVKPEEKKPAQVKKP
jgi:hypothetical protein